VKHTERCLYEIKGERS